MLRSKEKIETNCYKFKTKHGSFVTLQSQWFSFVNPWTKEVEYIVSTNTVISWVSSSARLCIVCSPNIHTHSKLNRGLFSHPVTRHDNSRTSRSGNKSDHSSKTSEGELSYVLVLKSADCVILAFCTVHVCYFHSLVSVRWWQEVPSDCTRYLHLIWIYGLCWKHRDPDSQRAAGFQQVCMCKWLWVISTKCFFFSGLSQAENIVWKHYRKRLTASLLIVIITTGNGLTFKSYEV